MGGLLACKRGGFLKEDTMPLGHSSHVRGLVDGLVSDFCFQGISLGPSARTLECELSPEGGDRLVRKAENCLHLGQLDRGRIF